MSNDRLREAAQNLIESMGPHQDLPPTLAAVDRLLATLADTVELKEPNVIREALYAAHEAIETAVLHEDGLDGAKGDKVMQQIRDALVESLADSADVPPPSDAASCPTCGDVPSFLRSCSFCGYTAICSAHQQPDPTCKTCFGERASSDAAPVAKGNPRVVEHHILCRYPTIAEIGCKLCIACGHAVIRGNQYRHAHPEDAPGGPWKKEALSLLASVIHAARVAGPFDTSRSPFEKGLQNAKKKLLDALGLNRLKGDET